MQLRLRRGDQQLNYQAELSQAPLDLLRTQPFRSERVPGNREQSSLRTTLASLGSVKIPLGKARCGPVA